MERQDSAPAGTRSLLRHSLTSKPITQDMTRGWTSSRTADLPSKLPMSCQLAAGRAKQAHHCTALGSSTSHRSRAAPSPASPKQAPTSLWSLAKPKLLGAERALSQPVLWGPWCTPSQFNREKPSTPRAPSSSLLHLLIPALHIMQVRLSSIATAFQNHILNHLARKIYCKIPCPRLLLGPTVNEEQRKWKKPRLNSCLDANKLCPSQKRSLSWGGRLAAESRASGSYQPLLLQNSLTTASQTMCEFARVYCSLSSPARVSSCRCSACVHYIPFFVPLASPSTPLPLSHTHPASLPAAS